MLRCKICAKHFLTRAAYLDHSRNDVDHLKRKRSRLDAAANLEPTTTTDSTHSLPCGLCDKTFDPDDVDDAKAHIATHVKDISGEHRCAECEIDFAHADVLRAHHDRVEHHQHCGMDFAHKCRGHHPPSTRARRQADRETYIALLRKLEAQRVAALRQGVVRFVLAIKAGQAKKNDQEAAAAAAAAKEGEEKREAEEAAKQQAREIRFQAVARIVAVYEKAGYSREQIAALLQGEKAEGK